MSISPLRQRMIDDMTARHFGEKTQKDYIRCVRNLAGFIGRPPETATTEELRLYRLHLVQSPLGAASVNSAMTALRFFFSITLDRYDLRKPLFRVEQPRKLPTVLTHRVAISNARLIAHDERGVAFHYKDYRTDGLARRKVMTLATDEFIRRFLLHILPKGFHRIRHYGLFASTGRAANIARLRQLLGPPGATPSPSQEGPAEEATVLPPCPCCGGRMIVIEFFERGMQPRSRAPSLAVIWIDTS